MRVLITGDRNWSDRESMMNAFAVVALQYGGDFEIIHGNAAGADKMAGKLAFEHGLKVHIFPAEWDKYGRAAGPIRNQQMLDEGKPQLCVAFHNDLANSKGTRDMVNRAKKAGLKVLLVQTGKEIVQI